MAANEVARGAGVRLEVGFTEGSAKVVSGVTKANPGVVSSTSHGLANGSVGYFDTLVGMAELEGQVARVSGSATGSFNAEGVDTTNFDTFTSGNFIPVTAWKTLSQSTEYQIGGGDGAVEDFTTLLDKKDKSRKVTLGAETVTINCKSLTADNEAMAKIRSTARALGYLVFRATLHDGSQRLFRGQPSLPGESLAVKGLGTGSVSVTVIGDVLYLGPIGA